MYKNIFGKNNPNYKNYYARLNYKCDYCNKKIKIF